MPQSKQTTYLTKQSIRKLFETTTTPHTNVQQQYAWTSLEKETDNRKHQAAPIFI